ncbi:MAG: putative LPS assembly protein LptD [Bacteroidia bacterium]|nr:putative LPS assembly protein LptD [Bacteroidia bacterium]MDW8015405.1 putative LPS assembly protein LptD [Bacteroidia bacterium]
MRRWQIIFILGLLGIGMAQLEWRSRLDSLPSSLRDSLVAQTPFNDTLVYQAEDSISFSVAEGRIGLYRGAALRYERMRLQSGIVILQTSQGLLYAQGYRQGDSLHQLPLLFLEGQQYEIDSLRYELKSRRGQLFGLRQQLTDEILAGQIVQMNPDGTFYAAGAYYTTCTARPPHFYIASSRIKLYPETRVVSGPLYMVAGEVPIPIFLPFGYFPLLERRSSGLILPLVGQAADRGFFLRGLGYYWAINRYMDLRLEADLFTRGGFRTEALWTYRKRYWYEGRFSLQYAYQFFNEPGDPDYQEQRMMFLSWQHRQTLSPTASLIGNVRLGSSTFLNRQSYTATDFLSTNLQSTITLQKSFSRSPWQLSLGALQNQNIVQRVWTLQLPIIALYQNRVFPFERKKRVGTPKWYERIGYTYRLDAQGQASLPESLLFTPIFRDTFQWGMRHLLQIAGGYTLFRYFQLTPNFTYNEYLYSEQIVYRLDSVEGTVRGERRQVPRTARDFSLSASLTTRIYGIRYVGFGSELAFRHTLIPTIAFTWRPDFSSEFWGLYQRFPTEDGRERRYNPLAQGFYGSPPAGRLQALQFSLNNLWEMRYRDRRDTLRRKFKYITLLDNVGLSTSYNFAVDSFRLSPVLLSARTNLLGQWLNLNYNAILDVYQYDSIGRRYPLYRWQVERKVGTITQMNWAIVTTLMPQKPPAPPGENEGTFVFFNLPWRMELSYNLTGVRQFFPDSARYKWIQTLGFGGEVNVTRNWRLQVNSGFDFIQKRIAFTSINIYRDLHCWEMSFSWIPFGPRQSYFFTLSARSPKLQDLRITKRRDWQDRFVSGL